MSTNKNHSQQQDRFIKMGKYFKDNNLPMTFENIANYENQTRNKVTKYDCPNCQGGGCVTCGGAGYLEY